MASMIGKIYHGIACYFLHDGLHIYLYKMSYANKEIIHPLHWQAACKPVLNNLSKSRKKVYII